MMRDVFVFATLAVLSGVACPVRAASLKVDFDREERPIRPALHSSGLAPMICGQMPEALDDIRSMGFKYARTHDWALANPGQRCCDYQFIFPLMHLDPKDPKNYVFGPTDYILKRAREEAGRDILFRLGTSIEHSGKAIHFNTLVPEDFEKVAEVFAATVRHYNRGWANGFDWNIRYWEIWNEPEAYYMMWCRPESVEGLNDEEVKKVRAELKQKFLKFYVIVLKRLKSEFGDTIRVGGPALCSYRKDWVSDILAACRDGGVAPDFLSWHGYDERPDRFVSEGKRARAACDSYGFTKCELIVDEWHYLGRKDYSMNELHRCTDPAVKARVLDGPNGHNGIKSAAFTLATLMNLQRSLIDQAYWYGCAHTGNWGYKDERQQKFKVFYALRLFGDIVRDYRTICRSESKDAYTTLAVKGADGKKALLVADYAGTSRTVEISIRGVSESARPKVTLLDHAHDFAPVEATFEKGLLRLTKPDEHSAAFFIEFPHHRVQGACEGLTPVVGLQWRGFDK